MNYKILLISVLAFFVTNCQNNNEKQSQLAENKTSTAPTIYQKAGTIKVRDPKAVITGYRQAGEEIFEISLDDIGKYTGHVCAGISSGFLLTKQALKKLYPEGQMPVRGQISIAASAYTDQAEVAAYIVRARQHEGDEKENNHLIIDQTLETAPYTVTLIFKRHDNGRMVKAVFDKSTIATPAMMKNMMPLKKKIMNGTASPDEKTLFAENVQKMVKKIITNTPEGLITVSDCTDYRF